MTPKTYHVTLHGQHLSVHDAGFHFVAYTWPTWAAADAARQTVIAQYNSGAVKWGYAPQPIEAFVITV